MHNYHRLFAARVTLAFIAPVFAVAQDLEVRGKVLDARSGEALERVRVEAAGTGLTTFTGPGGLFSFGRIPAGSTQLRVSAPGYALRKVDLSASGVANAPIEISLQPDADTIRTTVDVTAGVFEGAEGAAAPSEHTLSKAELQAGGTSLIADPLRAVQALPSVTVSNDGRGEISIRGSTFDRVALLVDGVLLDGFLHQISTDALGSDRDRASFSIVTPDRIAEVSLLNGAFPASQGFRTAGVVQLRTRDGNREKRDTRITSGITLGTAIVHDGPFAGKRGSYLAGFRSSALNPFNLGGPDQTFRFDDGQLKLLYDMSGRHRIGLSGLFGGFEYDDRKSPLKFGRNTATKADSSSIAVFASWDWTVNARLAASTKLFHTGAGLNVFNREALLLGRMPRKQQGGRHDWTLQTGRGGLVQAGAYVRSVAGEADAFLFTGAQQQARLLAETYRGSTTEGNYYGQTTQPLTKALSLTAGLRAETNRLTRETYSSPRVALAWSPGDRVSLRLGYGRHRQFADLTALLSASGNRNLSAERTDHYVAGVEIRTGSRSRARLDLFERRDRDQIFQIAEPRLVADRVTDFAARPENSLSGRARGFELLLQRRSGNRFSGWASYAYLRTRMRDRVSGLSFPTDFDQRHTGSFFGGYRISESWSMNAIYRVASGVPFAAFLRRVDGGQYFLAHEKNAIRLRGYGRLDLRLNKTFHWKASRWSLMIEGLNLLNQGNVTFNGIEDFDRGSGRILSPVTSYGITRAYSAGVTVQF